MYLKQSTFRSILLRVVISTSMVTSMSACNGITVVKEVELSGIGGQPTSVDVTPDGGFVLTITGQSSRIATLGPEGAVRWQAVEAQSGNVENVFRMVASLRDGGAIACGARKEAPPSRADSSGFVVRFDSAGREMARLESQHRPPSERVFFSTGACVPWADGFALLASEGRNDGDPPEVGAPLGQRSVLIKLDGQLRIVWRTPLLIGIDGNFAAERPRQLTNGDLVVLGGDLIYLVDSSGSIKKKVESSDCHWVRQVSQDSRLRVVCVPKAGMTGAWIVEYDASLNEIKNPIALHGQSGLPVLAVMPNRKFIGLMNGRELNGPEVTLFSESGEPAGKHNFTRGNFADVLPLAGGEVVVARYLLANRKLVPVLSWLKP